MKRTLLARFAAVFASLWASVALAQTTPSGLPPGGPQAPTEEKGAAEAAPKEKGKLPSVPVLPPWPGEDRKEMRLFEMDGYFRVRTDWFKRLHLGISDLGEGSPFPESLACRTPDTPTGPGVSDEVQALRKCGDTISTANLRLRLEPVINVSEDVAVKAQIDLLDNLVLGSTPDGIRFDGGAPRSSPNLGAFSDGVMPPERGVNATEESLVVKRAWAEVMTPLGMLKFGRMPVHWGLGMFHNSGAESPFDGSYCLDCDSGDTVDRIFFSTFIPGTDFRFGIAHEWSNIGLTTGTVNGGAGARDQNFDLEDDDDIGQWLFVLAKMDDLQDWNDQIERGELALNYGLYVLRRTQGLDLRYSPLNPPLDAQNPEELLVVRRLGMWMPNAFLRLAAGKTLLELEGMLLVGGMKQAEVVTVEIGMDGQLTENITVLPEQDILAFGAVARFHQLFLDDDLKLGFEAGYASGDQWDAVPQGSPHYTNLPMLPTDPNITDTTISSFRFDPNYHVDLILFREILGTVTNATYVKPSLSYNLTRRLKLSLAGLLAWANEPVSTPGNDSFWGVELDGDFGYYNTDENFFAGVSYGIFFPGGALDQPGVIFPNDQEAGTAQTLQTRLIVKF